MIFWIMAAVIGFGGGRALWLCVGLGMIDLKRLRHLDKAYSLPESDPEHRAQYALYRSLRRPTRQDCLAWATERELERELRRRRRSLRRIRLLRRICDKVLAMIDRLSGI